jgi:hypothetical protein
MDAYFNGYKARYDQINEYLGIVERSQYIKSMDIFINLDDVFHRLHRPTANEEVQIMGISAIKHCAVNIINLIAHYKWWATKHGIRARVFAIYTSSRDVFKNRAFVPEYRAHHADINRPDNQKFFFINDAISHGIPIAKNICDYVKDVFLIDSKYLEPSIIPLYLKQEGIACYDWNMLISKDEYDFQYAYRDNWFFVIPQGENSHFINRQTMWSFLVQKAKLQKQYNSALYHHNLYPLGLAIVGNKLRSIPRLKSIGWGTIFKYLDTVTEVDTNSPEVVSSRLLGLLDSKGVKPEIIQKNLAAVSVDTQVSTMGAIDKAMITDQIKYTEDHEVLGVLNAQYFEEYPINIPFLISSIGDPKPFFGK